ncbi:hypothetical protein NKH77_51405 [Streptomyces sp. M19]
MLAEPFGTAEHLVGWLRAAAARMPEDRALLVTAPSGDPSSTRTSSGSRGWYGSTAGTAWSRWPSPAATRTRPRAYGAAAPWARSASPCSRPPG